MFVATGQDAASAIENCSGQLTGNYDQSSGDLTLSLFIPSAITGSIGCGTAFPTQRETLALLGCRGTAKIWAFAEIMMAFALALDLALWF